MWEYYQWKQSDTWAKDVNASVIQVALHHSWVNQGEKKSIRKIEILWSLLIEKRLICKDTAKAKFKRKRCFSLNKKNPFISNICLHLCTAYFFSNTFIQKEKSDFFFFFIRETNLGLSQANAVTCKPFEMVKFHSMCGSLEQWNTLGDDLVLLYGWETWWYFKNALITLSLMCKDDCEIVVSYL